LRTLRLQPAPSHHVVADHLPGDASALVWLHGLSSTRRGEKSDALFAHARDRSREAWRFDFRGHGESSGRFGEVGLSDLIDDCICVLRESGPACLVGSSLGGLVAAWVAARQPELVTGLVLLAPAFWFLPRLRARLHGEATLRLPNGAVFEFGAAVLDDIESFDESALPGAIHQPVLCVHGALDDTVPVAASEQFVGKLPHDRKRLLVLPEGDHRLNREIDAILAVAGQFHAW
jgi:pimeloyl-ACP methyl ester carboxylesterase